MAVQAIGTPGNVHQENNISLAGSSGSKLASFSPMDLIPAEILIIILSQVNKTDYFHLKQVCRRWRDLVENQPIYWFIGKRISPLNAHDRIGECREDRDLMESMFTIEIVKNRHSKLKADQKKTAALCHASICLSTLVLLPVISKVGSQLSQWLGNIAERAQAYKLAALTKANPGLTAEQIRQLYIKDFFHFTYTG